MIVLRIAESSLLLRAIYEVLKMGNKESREPVNTSLGGGSDPKSSRVVAKFAYH